MGRDGHPPPFAHDEPHGYPLAPHYLVHVGEDGSVLLPFTQAKGVLDRLKRLCVGRDLPDASAYARFDKATKQGGDMSHACKLLSAAVASVIGKSEERAVASLFTPGGTHAKKGEFAGINDFEVVAFLVILPEATSPDQPVETEVAVFTLKFEKPDDGVFSAADQALCIEEGKGSLARLFKSFGIEGAIFEIRHIGDGEGSFWAEFVVIASIAFGVTGGLPNLLHMAGGLLDNWGGAYSPYPDLHMQRAGKWLKGVAWRLTPQADSDTRRPGCFGIRKWLDRRTVRCRDCGFLVDCVKAIESL